MITLGIAAVAGLVVYRCVSAPADPAKKTREWLEAGEIPTKLDFGGRRLSAPDGGPPVALFSGAEYDPIRTLAELAGNLKSVHGEQDGDRFWQLASQRGLWPETAGHRGWGTDRCHPGFTSVVVEKGEGFVVQEITWKDSSRLQEGSFRARLEPGNVTIDRVQESRSPPPSIAVLPFLSTPLVIQDSRTRRGTFGAPEFDNLPLVVSPAELALPSLSLTSEDDVREFFDVLDQLRVVTPSPNPYWDGIDPGIMPRPQRRIPSLGIGRIVPDGKSYLVERTTDDGKSIWVRLAPGLFEEAEEPPSK